MIEQLEEKITLVCKRRDMIGLRDWWIRINEAYDQGYRFKDHNLTVSDCPTFNPVPRITLYHQSYIESDIETEKLESGIPVDWEERLRKCRKSSEVRKFADKYAIKLPVDEPNQNKLKAVIKKEIAEREAEDKQPEVVSTQSED